MVPNVGDRNFTPASEIYTSIIRILHLSFLYFPQGSSKGNAYLATSTCYSISVHFKPFLSALDEYRVMHDEFVNTRVLRRLLKICLVVYVIGTPMVSLGLSTSLLKDKVWNGVGDMFYPFSTDIVGSSIIMYIVLNVISFAVLSIISVLMTLFITIPTIVCGEMNNLTERLKIITAETQIVGRKEIAFITPSHDRSLLPTPKSDDVGLTKATDEQTPKEKPLELYSKLEEVRLRYESVLDIVTKANLVLQHLFFSTLATSIPVSCLVLYGFITLNSNRAQMVLTGLTNIYVFNMLFWIFILGIYTERKIQLFTARYLAPSLGFDVYGPFSLDSSAFLTVFGTLLTYAVVIFQFAQRTSEILLNTKSKWFIFPSSWCSSFVTSRFQTNLTNVAVVIPSNSRCIGILTLNGNMFESVQGVPTDEKIFPNIRYKLNGKKIIIGVVPDNPFEKNYYNILHTMSRYLNFTYDIVNSTNSEYGILRNGTWSGLVGQLVNHEIDLGLTSLSTIEDRRNAVDFINPFGTSKPGILYKRELLVGDSWFLLTRPLQFKVYLCTIISFICVSLFFIFLSNRESNDQHGNRIANTVEFVLAALLLEGGNFHLKGTSARILFSFWLMFGVVLAATYTATLLRSLVPKQKEPFETIKGLLDLPDWQIGVLGGTAEIIVFNTSENNDVKMFWKTLNSRTQKDANIQSTDTNVHMKRVSQGKYAFLTLDGRAIIKVHGDCSLKFNDRLFNVPSTEYSMAVPQGSVLKTELDDFVDKIENSGLLDEMMKPQDNRPSQCGVIDQRVKPLFLDNVKGVFALLAGGVVVAGITLVVEKVLHLRRASGSIR
ncbi:hypothetical protein LOTGIDRAFT_173932 [Lottia gigantea]|uniref:Ionotropic glutamate receptor L-glutamate and glycine-binding domain-containing protein n=1 Tax=Lottia gigantea TaxID=225164 RepID=V4CB78_LOTGI|nr:hypothetical protein LOTGIDRAFT_173932 [Lottia gigantea]ESO99094.1 hypothetical protein LOTGIDRAFT_173932 [Lottia gigantea]